MADQVLIFADTERSPELRHELPVAIGDAFLYAENNGSRYVLTNVLEVEKMKKLGVETRMPDDYGIDELLKSGKKPREIRNELLLRACRDLGITDAAVPFWFPSISPTSCAETESSCAPTKSCSTSAGVRRTRRRSPGSGARRRRPRRACRSPPTCCAPPSRATAGSCSKGSR